MRFAKFFVRPDGWWIFLLGLSLITACANITPSSSETQPVDGRVEIPSSDVIVALQPIPKGTEFGQDSIGRRDWPVDNVPPGGIADEVETIGQVATTDILPGQVINRNMLSNSSSEVDRVNSLISDSDFNVASSAPNIQPQTERTVIYTGNMVLIVKNVEQAITDITNLAGEQGGYVSASTVYQQEEVPRGNITIRVQADLYETTLIALEALAIRVDRQETRTQDVTEEFIDINARLVNLVAEERALQEVLNEQENQDSLADVLAVRQELVNTRSQIEQIEGRLRFLSDQTALSTITIELIPDVLYQPVSVVVWEPQGTAKTAIQDLVVALQGLVDDLIRLVLIGLPLAIIYLVPIVVIIWLLRKWWRVRGRKT